MKNHHFATLFIVAIFSLAMLHSGCQSGAENKGSSDTAKKAIMHTTSRYPFNIKRPDGLLGDAAGTNATVNFGVRPPGTGGDLCQPGPSLCGASAGVNTSTGSPGNFINAAGYGCLSFDPTQLTPDIDSYFMAYRQQAWQGAVVINQNDCPIDPSLVKQWGLSGPITLYSGLPMFLSTDVGPNHIMEYIIDGLIPGHRGVISIGTPTNDGGCDASQASICSITAYTPDAPNVVLIDTENNNGIRQVNLTFNINAMQPGWAQSLIIDTVNWRGGDLYLTEGYEFTEPISSTSVAQGSTFDGGTYYYKPWPTIPWGSKSYVFSGWITVFISPLYAPEDPMAMKIKASMKKNKKR